MVAPDRRISRAAEILVNAPDGMPVAIDPAEVIRAALENVAVLAVRQHPLGFLHFDLTPLAADAAATLRLHLWSNRSVLAADELGKRHDHVWVLRSAVLLGALTDIQFVAAPDPAGGHVAVQVVYGETENQIRPTGERFALRETRRRVVTAGQVYTLEERSIHETIVSVFPTLTLLAAIPADGGSPLVLAPFRREPYRVTSSRPSIPAEAAGAELASALDTLRSS